MLTKRMKKNPEDNYTRMLQAMFNRSWRKNPTEQLLYGHLPPITKNTKVRRIRHAGHCLRIRDEPIGDIFLWTPLHGPARTYIKQLYADTRCNLEDLLEAMKDREGWWGRVREICTGGATW